MDVGHHYINITEAAIFRGSASIRAVYSLLEINLLKIRQAVALGQCHGQPDGLQHTFVASNALSGDIEGGPVID